MLKTLHIDEDLCRMLPQLRKYAGISGDIQDSILLACLRTAIIEVQDRSDRSVCPCTMRLNVKDNQDTDIRLYGDVAEVKSVTSPSGVQVPYTLRPDGYLDTGLAVYDTLVIEYTTGPEEGERQRLMPVVFQYASALFDGQGEELRNILAQC